VNQTASRVIYLIPEAGLGPFSSRLKTFHLQEHIREGRLFCRTLSSPGSLSLTDSRLLDAVRGADVFLDTAIRFMTGTRTALLSKRSLLIRCSGCNGPALALSPALTIRPIVSAKTRL